MFGAIALVGVVSFQGLSDLFNPATNPASDFHWFFGDLTQRLDYHNWIRLTRRFGALFGHPVLFPLFVLAVVALTIECMNRRASRGAEMAFYWLVDNAIATLLFFNVNLVHSYYQLPFLPLYALGGHGGEVLLTRFTTRARRFEDHTMAVTVVSGLVVLHLVQFASWLPTAAYRWNSNLVLMGSRFKT